MAEATAQGRLASRRGQPLDNSLELAWAAGFFDGEGTTYSVLPPMSRRVGKRRALLRLSVGQLDRRPLLRFASAFSGFGSVHRPDKTSVRANRLSNKPLSRWQAGGRSAGVALSLLWPYLSEPKREQAKRAMKKTGEYNRAL